MYEVGEKVGVSALALLSISIMDWHCVTYLFD